MNIIKKSILTALTASLLAAPLAVFGADTNAPAKSAKKLIPYTLETCPVSGEKLGEMGKAFVYEYKGREIKFCCKDCRKDFDKNPEKFLKKIAEAEKKAAEKAAKTAPAQ